MNKQKLYKASFQRIIDSEYGEGDFFKMFYSKFTARSEQIRKKFVGTNWETQISMLKNSLIYIQQFSETQEASPRLIELAKAHSKEKLNIHPSLYDDWLEAFIQTLWFYDPQCNKEIESLWREVLTPGINLFKSYYNKTT